MQSKININKLNEFEKSGIEEKLSELTEVRINLNASLEERMIEFLSQVNNPYCFCVNGTPVKVSFSNQNKTIDKSLHNYLINRRNSSNYL